MAPIRLEIVTAERLVYSEEIDVLVVPGVEGELGILPSHAPLLTALKPGEIRLVKDGDETYMAVSGGFIEGRGNKATILADTAERAEEIDEERAEKALKRSEAGSLPMVFPTLKTLEALAGLDSTTAVLEEFQSRTIPSILPRLIRTRNGVILRTSEVISEHER